MRTPAEQFEKWLRAPSEDEHLEFKEAKWRYDFEKLVKYCCALSNEGGGNILLGVTNALPRRVIGTPINPEAENSGLSALIKSGAHGTTVTE